MRLRTLNSDEKALTSSTSAKAKWTAAQKGARDGATRCARGARRWAVASTILGPSSRAHEGLVACAWPLTALGVRRRHELEALLKVLALLGASL
eukprot:4038789-Prymnesium_polylepis.1